MCHNKLYASMDHVLTNTFLLSGKRYLLSDPYTYILCPALIQDVEPSSCSFTFYYIIFYALEQETRITRGKSK